MTSARPDFCFSIVSHKQGALVRDLLADLRHIMASHAAAYEIIVTLNLPEDEAFLHEFTTLPLRVLRNAVAKGFGANHNAAFRESTAALFAVVNPDVRLQSLDFGLIRSMLSDRGVGLWAPKVVASSGTVEDSARRFPTFARLCRRVILRQRNPDYSSDAGVVAVDWVAGMFMVLPRHVYVDVGGFDERYFMYLEDADICRRVHARRLRVVYDTRVSVTHDARRASRRDLQHLTWHLSSMIRFLTSRRMRPSPGR
jgi:N-acetylglucosaminyl-diphospho-decaprenol L-rhamnosyltransferase